VLLDLPIAVYYAQPNPKLKFVGPTVGPGYYAIAFRKDQEALAAQFDKGPRPTLAQRRVCGGIYEKWKIWNDQQEELYTERAMGDVLGESARTGTSSSTFRCCFRERRSPWN